MWRFRMVFWVGRQCVIVVLPDHTHFLFCQLSVFGPKELLLCVIFSVSVSALLTWGLCLIWFVS